jgi:hypothetical protein
MTAEINASIGMTHAYSAAKSIQPFSFSHSPIDCRNHECRRKGGMHRLRWTICKAGRFHAARLCQWRHSDAAMKSRRGMAGTQPWLAMLTARLR